MNTFRTYLPTAFFSLLIVAFLALPGCGGDEEGSEEQLSDAWMGKFVGEYLASSAAKLEASGKIKALSDYNALINTSYLAAAAKM